MVYGSLTRRIFSSYLATSVSESNMRVSGVLHCSFYIGKIKINVTGVSY
jgi:hypothetical protein